MDEHVLARILGWVSIGVGLSAIAAMGAMLAFARRLGAVRA